MMEVEGQRLPPRGLGRVHLRSLEVSMDGTLLPRGRAAQVAGYPVGAPLVALLKGVRALSMALPS